MWLRKETCGLMQVNNVIINLLSIIIVLVVGVLACRGERGLIMA